MKKKLKISNRALVDAVFRFKDYNYGILRVWQANGWMCTFHLTKVAKIRKYIRNWPSDFDLNLFSTK